MSTTTAAPQLRGRAQAEIAGGDRRHRRNATARSISPRRRAARIGAGVIMLRVIETHDRNQQWLGVADIMKAEAHEEANAALDKYATRANGIAGITPSG